MPLDPPRPQPVHAATTPTDGAIDDWPEDADPLPDGWADLAVEVAPARSPIDWESLEVAADRVLPGGLRLVGRIEDVRVPLLGDVVIGARLETGSGRSRLHGTEPGAEGDSVVRLLLGGRAHLLHTREEAGERVVDAEIVLGAERLSVVLHLDGQPAEPGLTLGAHDLAGRYVVDPGSERRLGDPT